MCYRYWTASSLPVGVAERYAACALAARAHTFVVVGAFVAGGVADAGGGLTEGVVCWGAAYTEATRPRTAPTTFWNCTMVVRY